MSTGGATDPKRRRVTAHARQTDPVTVPVDPVDAVAVGLVPELGARDGASARAPHATATGSLSPHTCRVEGAAAPTPNVRTTASSASTRNGGGGGEAECPPTVTVTVAQALRHRGSPPATATANPTARHSHASACDGVTVPLPAADPGGHIERVPAASTRRVEKTCTPSFEPTHAHRHTGPVAAGSTIIAPASGSHPVETHASVQPPPDTGIDEPTCAPCCEHTPPLGGRAPPSEKVLAIAAAFRRADRVLILAGAGFSAGSCCADGSRLPDYRSTNSFATAYAPLAERGLNYRTIATPAFFSRDPSTAWGFYASRMKMYNEVGSHPQPTCSACVCVSVAVAFNLTCRVSNGSPGGTAQRLRHSSRVDRTQVPFCRHLKCGRLFPESRICSRVRVRDPRKPRASAVFQARGTRHVEIIKDPARSDRQPPDVQGWHCPAVPSSALW
eukprot:m.38946 g.38946  ORF g.38946 m.38946 type:complete len:445 (-) comp13546_c0_seq1:538-1872(-)